MTELLTVVAMIGVITLVTVPAFVQLMPQYRIRSAASEAGAALRMLRQKAITTRTPWKASFDAAANQYSYSKLTSPDATRSTASNWVNIGRDGRPSASRQWIRAASVDLRTTTTNPFKDVGCDAGANLDFTVTSPSLLFAVDNSFVKFNRYYIALTKNGLLSIRAAKE